MTDLRGDSWKTHKDLQMKNLIARYVRHSLFEMSTRYKRETGKSLPRWRDRMYEYNGLPGHFVHFSDYPKFGLNPINRYGTPTGFYSYPMDVDFMSDFARDRKFAIIFKLKPEKNYLKFQSYNGFQADQEELRKKYETDVLKFQGLNGRSQGWDNFVKETSFKARFNRTQIGQLWNLTRNLSIVLTSPEMGGLGDAETTKNPGFSEEKEKRLDALNWALRFMRKKSGNSSHKPITYRDKQSAIQEYDMYLDSSYANIAGKTHDQLSQQEKEQALSGVTKKELQIVQVDKDKKYQIDRTKADALKYVPLNTTFKNIQDKSFEKDFVVNSPANMWAKILHNDLKYDGAIDAGMGLIHPEESSQAVFFSTDSVELVEIIKKSDSTIMTPSSISLQNTDMFYNGVIHFDLVGLNLNGVDFRSSTGVSREINGSTLKQCEFENIRWRDFVIRDSGFVDSIFVEAEIIGSKAFRSDFSGTDFNGAVITGCVFDNCDFSFSNFSPKKLVESKFNRCNFSRGEASGFDASNIIFTRTKFTDSQLHSVTTTVGIVTFDDVKFSGGFLENCTLTTQMKNVEFNGASLDRVIFLVRNANDMAGCKFTRNCFLQNVRIVPISSIKAEEIIPPVGTKIRDGFLVIA
jgi:uncharacterized protein YjbI with pentapeptide repeats